MNSAFASIFGALAIGLILFLSACRQNEGSNRSGTLPIIGEVEIVDGDTVFHQIGDWAFYRQDSQLVTEDQLAGKVYVADFFFTSCPTICPRVTHNMLRIHDRFKEKENFKLLSFTVDPKRDSVGHLRNYSQNLGITDADKWWFLTGDKLELYDIADDYFSVAIEDQSSPGGFDHSGRILFVDGEGHVRAFADGTDEKEVDELIAKIEAFLQSNASESAL